MFLIRAGAFLVGAADRACERYRMVHTFCYGELDQGHTAENCARGDAYCLTDRDRFCPDNDTKYQPRAGPPKDPGRDRKGKSYRGGVQIGDREDSR